MDWRPLEGERSHVLVFRTGEACVEGLAAFAGERGIRAARFSGIGALERAELGFYDSDRKDYQRFELRESELLSLMGNVSVADGDVRVHAHATLSGRDGSAYGGHLFEGWVGPTLEVFLVAFDGELVREMDEGVGLALLRP